jgi:hypothetical protein
LALVRGIQHVGVVRHPVDLTATLARIVETERTGRTSIGGTDEISELADRRLDAAAFTHHLTTGADGSADISAATAHTHTRIVQVVIDLAVAIVVDPVANLRLRTDPAQANRRSVLADKDTLSARQPVDAARLA